MAITTMHSYELKGNKLSFANWISQLSPTETPFTSMTGKEAISQTKFQWQTDHIPTVKANAQIEGSIPTDDTVTSTEVESNVAQIFRRGVAVSDTANAVAFYGRGKEIGYQMEKAGTELKRDMETAFLYQGHAGANAGEHGQPADSTKPALTAGFLGLVAAKDAIDGDTKAKVHQETADNKLTEIELFNLTYNLYLAGSKANIIMFHPKHAHFFSTLVEVADAADLAVKGARMKMFGAMDDKYNTEVDTIIDPLGQKFALVPNRFMPEGFLYFFNPSDWTQMVLRAPKKIQLAKAGSLEQWMIEAEVGLRHRHPFASGILKVKA